MGVLELQVRTQAREPARLERESLPVIAEPGSVAPATIAAPATPIVHAERAQNIALLESLVDDPTAIDLDAVYDAMVNGVVRTSLLGEAPRLGQSTVAVLAPGTSTSALGMSASALAESCNVVCTIEGDTLVAVGVGQRPQRFKLTRHNDALVATPAGEPSAPGIDLDTLLPMLLGVTLEMPIAGLLGGMEVGGQGYATRDSRAVVLADAQAGAILDAKGKVVSFFSNDQASQAPSGHDVLFGYHTHPLPDRRLLPPGQRPVDPARASGPDLIAFGHRSEEVGRSVPQIVWYQSAENQMTGLIYVPTKDKWGWAAPLRPQHTITVTV